MSLMAFTGKKRNLLDETPSIAGSSSCRTRS
jgi:hypothetical protein